MKRLRYQPRRERSDVRQTTATTISVEVLRRHRGRFKLGRSRMVVLTAPGHGVQVGDRLSFSSLQIHD